MMKTQEKTGSHQRMEPKRIPNQTNNKPSKNFWIIIPTWLTLIMHDMDKSMKQSMDRGDPDNMQGEELEEAEMQEEMEAMQKVC